MIVKNGDTHAISWRANMDLTGAEVRVIARMGAVAVTLDVTVTDGPNGVVTHSLTGTLSPGSYAVELEVTTGNQVITFPNDGYETLTVMEDLG